jgi:hypothetical protein
MANQNSINQIKGTIDKLTYYRGRDGKDRVKRKTELDPKRIKTEASFLLTRQNNAEFSRATKAGQEIRHAISEVLRFAKDRHTVSRLVKETLKVVKSDSTNPRGDRLFTNGNLSLLNGFECNINAPLIVVFTRIVDATIDRAAGTLTASVPTHIPNRCILAPAGATHFKVISVASELDFTANSFVTDIKEGAYEPINGTSVAAFTLVNQLTANSDLPIFHYLGIQFFQLVNGNYDLMSNGGFNCLKLQMVHTV